MPFRLVFLSTDILVFLLLVALAVFALYARRHEHLRAPWRQVRRRPLGMAASVVLIAYVTIGLLDTVHLQWRLSATTGQTTYAPQIESLLDRICRPLRDRTEKTYSAPFATHAFTKEVVRQPGGTVTLEYPRLRFTGMNLVPQIFAHDFGSPPCHRIFVSFGLTS